MILNQDSIFLSGGDWNELDEISFKSSAAQVCSREITAGWHVTDGGSSF